MIRCKKQFIAFFMAISIIFCVGSESYIKAEALEWAIPTITAAEAIKWLLGLLGVTVAGAAIADTDYEQLVENYTNYAELKGQTAVETGKFWADIIDGSLDTGSQAWTNFKEWVSSLTATSSNTGLDLLNSLNIDSSSFDSSTLSHLQLEYNYFFVCYSGANIQKIYFVNDFVLSLDGNYIDINNSTIEDKTNSRRLTLNFEGGTFLSSQFIDKSLSYGRLLNITTYREVLVSPSVLDVLDLSGFSNVLDYTGVSGKTFLKYSNIVNDFGFILSSAISDAIPDVIPLPWDQVSDTAEGINDKINELIEKVNEGVLSLEDYMIAIQSILGVIAFDTTTDLVIPSDPDLPDETIQDRINENVANNGFVLSGLENFFPFCIPFDIYAFITILVAEPVAPVIHWEIYNPVTNENNEIVLDFAMWESVVILMRYIFDFLFIIGLALLARSLIGGDD